MELYFHLYICLQKVMWSCPCALTEHHTMKAYWGCGGITPHILELKTRWKWVVSSTPRPLYPQVKRFWYPMDRRVGGPQSQSGHSGEKKNSQPLPWLKPPIIQPIVQHYTTELSWLLHVFMVSCLIKWGICLDSRYLLKHRDSFTVSLCENCITNWFENM
jgi:hypothetical protein